MPPSAKHSWRPIKMPSDIDGGVLNGGFGPLHTPISI